MRILWLQSARVEAAASARYYGADDVERGLAFAQAIRERLDFVKQFPEAGTRVPRSKDVHVRRVLEERFEYCIVYVLLEDEILVVAVHHQRRKPGYWKPRLAKVRR